jgi:hypothetical protein
MPALEPAVDQQLYAADAHPFVALVLLKRRFFDELADACGLAHPKAR